MSSTWLLKYADFDNFQNVEKWEFDIFRSSFDNLCNGVQENYWYEYNKQYVF